MTYRAAANIDPNQHKGLIASNSINNAPLVLTGLSLTNAQPLHVAIVDASGSQITTFGSTPITNYALETGGNLATIAGKDFATQATLALIKAKTDNLDVLLSTRTKPADAQHVIVDSGVTTGLTDTQLRATPVPVSGTVTATTGGLTDTQLRASAVPISNTNLDVALSTRLKPADTLTKVATVDTITNPVAVTGTFWQSTQPVSLATNTPTLQSGSTTAVTQPTGTNLHTVVDSGTITAVTGITNALPAGTNNIGKVTEVRADTSPATANITAQDTNSTTTAGQNNQSFITGSPTANSTASFALSGQNTINMMITGTWTGTLASEVSFDGGTTWFTRSLHQLGTNYNTSNFTSNAQGVGEVSGATNYRVRATAAMTGTATITLIESLNPASFYLINTPQLADGTVPTQKLAIDTSGQAASLARKKAGTTTTSANVSTSTTVATLVASNTSRIKATVYNDSTTGVLYVKEGAAASATSFDYALAAATSTSPGGTLIVDDYNGIITGILSAGTGTARCGET